jgi:pimeloyl-ACP methyl ester carboxylesterase
MRLTLNKTRRNMALLLSVALIGAVLGFPSAATAADPTCTTAAAVTTCTGETSDKAKYEVRVPDDFNGTLLLWSHGYTYVAKIPAQVPLLGGAGNDLRATIAPGAPDSMVTANALLNQGYALAGSGFAVPGWNAESAVKTNVELLGVVKKKFPKIKRTVAWGASLGGTITQRLAETNPKLIDAALPIMAFNNIDKVVGSNGGYGTDAVWLFKMFFDPTIKGFGYSAGPAGFGEAAVDFGKVLAAVVAIQGGLTKTGADTWPATATLVPAAVKAALPARSALLMVGLLSGMPMRSTSFDGVTGTPIDTSSIAAASASTSAATGFSLAVQPALAVAENMVNIAGFATFARYDLESQVGNKNFADNQKTNYAAKLSEEEAATYNVALSGETGVAGLLQLVAGFQAAAPLKADADALAKLKKLDTMTGQINVPTIAFNNVEETVEFQPMMSWMIEKANAQHAAAVAAAKAKKKKAPAKKFAAFWGTPLDEYTQFNADGTPKQQAFNAGTGHVQFTQTQWMDMVRLGDMAARLKRLPSESILQLTRESDPNWYPSEDFDADTVESIGS